MASKNIYYSYQKGKHGGTAGYIFPFFTKLNSIFPDEEYKDLIPAGYLKCQGQILSANNYRNLANVIGVGSQCIYRQDGVTLQEPDPDGTGGQIQLPDLGSKYIVGSTNPGTYNNTDTSDGSITRAGLAVEVDSLGDTAEFFYQGDFKIPARDLTVSGNIGVIGAQALTEETELNMSNFLPHGHNTTFSISARINFNDDAMGTATWRRRSYLCGRRGTVCSPNQNYGLNYLTATLTEFGSAAAATHFHGNALPIINSESKSAVMGEVLINASPLVTTIRVRTNQQLKMDEFAPRYILCEYLIKS